MASVYTSGFKEAYVLYVDHEGHVAPLSRCYHATASRRLSSSIDDKHPPSTVTEVDSAFCPQCLSFYDAATAATLGYCPKVTCKRCPVCTSVLSLAFENNKCFYVCGYCTWTSEKCGLTVDMRKFATGGAITKETMAKATERMGKWLEEKEGKGDGPAQNHYRAMLDALDEIGKTEVRRKNHTGLIGQAPLSKKPNLPWSIETLEDSIRQKQEQAAEIKTVGGFKTKPITKSRTLDSSLGKVSVESLFLQKARPTASLSDLLPLRIPLRARKSRRCRAELAEGRPGILVKPKLNPLEGDSSLRTGHGQWWKKDSGAVNVIPKLTVQRHSTNGDKAHSFLLKVANPTLGTVNLRLGRSTYQGEPTWDDKTVRTTELTHVLVDSLRRTYLDAKLNTGVTPSLETSNVVTLDSVDDTFLDIGRSEIPKAVTSWKAPESVSKTQINIVASKGDSAWLEVNVNETVEGDVPAIPLSLEIEVGNGSWESSLVKPRTDSDGPDYVCFDVVLLWKT